MIALPTSPATATKNIVPEWISGGTENLLYASMKIKTEIKTRVHPFTSAASNPILW